MEEDNLYEEEERGGRLIKLAAVVVGILGFVSVVAFMGWNVYRSLSGGMMWEEVRWADPNNAMPWEEGEWLMYDEKRGGGKPETFEGQPEIIEGLKYESQLRKEGKTYGEIKLRVRGDGTVVGEWSGEFKKGEPEKRYTVIRDRRGRYPTNSFRGNIVKTKIYSDEEGEDRSKLYFIARGELLLEEFDYKMRDSREIKGDVYVTGWMGSEYDVEGKLYLCWGSLLERVEKMRQTRERGEERDASALLTPGKVEVFEWEGEKVADSE
jgi:hypothetical protein